MQHPKLYKHGFVYFAQYFKLHNEYNQHTNLPSNSTWHKEWGKEGTICMLSWSSNRSGDNDNNRTHWSVLPTAKNED